jgi:cytochrome c biogenesis protein CcdA
MSFLKALFSPAGILVGLYFILGIFINTAPPHIPSQSFTSVSMAFHSWIQYIISVAFWPLGLWHPVITTGKWTP